ncbi:hypothetical protein V5N11_031660 [Cardamine amara subsp. amara]|uniref:NYN domain-containing protein n=1 Tax=Cardamine amara subsp. amara TaxID=228776 RepID=A0ABD1C757_CARAN
MLAISGKTLRRDFSKAYTCVFWDVEDLGVPDDHDPVSICQNINSALTNKGYQEFGMVEFRAYGELNKIWDEFILAGIRVIPAGEKCERVKRMVWDILLWAMQNPSEYHNPLNVMVISKNMSEDREFLGVLLGLESRGYNVLLADSGNVESLNQLPFVSSVWLWKSLSDGGYPFVNGAQDIKIIPTDSEDKASQGK